MSRNVPMSITRNLLRLGRRGQTMNMPKNMWVAGNRLWVTDIAVVWTCRGANCASCGSGVTRK